MLNAAELIGTHDVLMVTIDSLRYDVAVKAMESGLTPRLAAVVPNKEWELRHTPGNFTYAAHQAFFAGFLPTPAQPGKHPRLFAAKFPGSETTHKSTCVFDAADIVTGMRKLNYHTICVGGVGFFNMRSKLGSTLPELFDEAHWNHELGVTNFQSTKLQVKLAIDCIDSVSATQRLFLFLNVSATHQPNKMYVPGAEEDSFETQVAALAYVDSHLGCLLDKMKFRSPTLAIVTSDHGTAYGEDGYWGHRICHPTVWNVPYAEFLL